MTPNIRLKYDACEQVTYTDKTGKVHHCQVVHDPAMDRFEVFEEGEKKMTHVPDALLSAMVEVIDE